MNYAKNIYGKARICDVTPWLFFFATTDCDDVEVKKMCFKFEIYKPGCLKEFFVFFQNGLFIKG